MSVWKQEEIQELLHTAGWRRGFTSQLNLFRDRATAQGNLPEAQRLFGKSLRIRQRLAESDSANAAWQRDLAGSYQRFAMASESPRWRMIISECACNPWSTCVTGESTRARDTPSASETLRTIRAEFEPAFALDGSRSTSLGR